MNNNNSSLGNLLQVARENKKLTLRAVEKAIGVSNAYLSQLESGKIKKPSPAILYKLGQIYDIPYVEIMEIAGYPSLEQQTAEISNIKFSSRIGPITNDEENSLIEYLAFLRSRSRKG